MKRNGEVGNNSIEWVSKYGSVGVSTWDIAIADGMNEKGLVSNLLWLVESNYPAFNKEGNTKGMAISLWAQYVLDNFATVVEAVKELRKESFAIVSDFIPAPTNSPQCIYPFQMLLATMPYWNTSMVNW